MSKKHHFSTHIDLPVEKRERLVTLLNQNLANAFDLASQIKQAHWNLKGMQFIALHLLFDEIHQRIDDHSDTIAERIAALGGEALGTARMAAAQSKLQEFPVGLTNSKEFVQALVERFAPHAASIRKAIDTSDELGDKGTADLFTQISRDVDKDMWFLEAHIQEAV